MERMIKRIAIRKDGTISMSEFRNFAEKYQGEIDKLEEENKKLKSDLAYERTMLDNVRAEYESLQNVNKNLKEKVKTLELGLDNKEKVNKSLREENQKLIEDLKNMRDYCSNLDSENDNQAIEIEELKKENRKLKHENGYRAGIVDILPKGKRHIAEETIQDLQKRIEELVWFEKEYHRSRDRIKKLEWILEHEYGRKVSY